MLVAVGYMDPGNWATSMAAGSRYGYSMLWVIALSSGLAMLMQAAAARLGLGARVDLAQACRLHFTPAVNLALWVLCEVAIAACCLAEVLGMAIALQLLLHIPLPAGVLLTVLDTFLILLLLQWGFGRLEAVIVALVGLIALCFVVQMVWLSPQWVDVWSGLRPRTATLLDPEQIYLAAGIVGATVMPHNLYLHSAVVQTRPVGSDIRSRRVAIRVATRDSSVSLALAGLVSAAILILAAGAFHRSQSTPVDDLAQAFQLLSPALGVGAASLVFGVALLASGMSASVTGALAGQIAMEGFLKLKMSVPARRVLTRAVAVVPAFFVTLLHGSKGLNELLVFSQVVLSLQLPFAIFPLLWFTTRKAVMGELAFGRTASRLLWACGVTITVLNLWMVSKLCAT
jgi:manganese transport protein